MSAYLNEKYAVENVKNTLSFLAPYKCVDPPINYFKSAFFPPPYDDDSASSPEYGKLHNIKIYYRNTKQHAFIKHWYIDIDGTQRWHPGEKQPPNGGVVDISSPPPILISTNEGFDECLLAPRVTGVLELCSRCLYWYLLDKFNKDRYFNIFFHNCELILGYRNETMYSYLVFTCLVLFMFTRILFFLLLLAIFLTITLVMFGKDTVNVAFHRCKHVKAYVRNSIVL
ncbi:Ac81 [Cotesia congregata filamentous virus 1]|uniref:Ac81 n=1 Tax=Cotesia congregata filamentous virus 1 TaxID=3064291 RepID=A0ABC8QPL1_9VIRU|nr:Ac81 [Cotesia congregata filamentous virus 1]